ncbi:MAG: pilZ domain protein [Sphingomonas bacterium]|nr:pilZ domain protein [Sphingomonas bacterium]
MDGVVQVGTVGADEIVGTVDNARTRKRDSMFLSAQLRIGGEGPTHEVRVRNLSAGGLMAELDCTVEPGTPVALAMRGLGDMTGSVAWCTHGRLGIALDRPIDPARARKPVGLGPSTPEFAKPLVGRTPRR